MVKSKRKMRKKPEKMNIEAMSQKFKKSFNSNTCPTFDKVN